MLVFQVLDGFGVLDTSVVPFVALGSRKWKGVHSPCMTVFGCLGVLKMTLVTSGLGIYTPSIDFITIFIVAK